MELIGYAARFRVNSSYSLEKLTYESKSGSINELIDSDRYSVNLHTLYESILFISLLALPLFAMIIVLVTYLECTKKCNTQYEDLSSVSNLEPVNLKYMMYSVVIICIPASGTMMYFQLRSFFTGKNEWCYNYPYFLMWISIILYVYAASKVIDKVERDENRDRLTTFKLWKEGALLWIVNMTAQLVSWNLVFVVCGFILNPLRALLYSMVIIVTVVCLVVLVAIILKFICITTCCSRGNQTLDNHSVDNSPHCTDVAIMFSLIMLLICAFAYIVFIFQISITINNQTIEDVTQSIAPSVFLIIIAWLLPKLYLDPNTLLKYITKN